MRDASRRVVQGLGVLGSLAALIGVFFLLNPTESAGNATDVDLGTAAVAVGQPAPLVTGTTLEGEPFALAEAAGRPVWMVVNATWCTSCRAEIPDIQAVHDSDLGDQIEIVSVYLGESADVVQGFVDRLGLTYTAIPDPDSAISQAFGVPGIPVHYFIDADGVIQAIEIGTLGRSEMEARIVLIS